MTYPNPISSTNSTDSLYSINPLDSIENVNLSARTHNALRRAGIHNLADLLAYDREKISDIRNLGSKSLDEINQFLDSLEIADYKLSFKSQMKNAEENHACKTFVYKISSFLPIDNEKLYEVLLPVFERNKGEESDELFAVPYLRNAIKHRILDFLTDHIFGVKHSMVEALIPESIVNYRLKLEILAEMESDKQIIIGKDKIERRLMTIFEYAQTIPKEKERDFFLKRLRGMTLEAIGGKKLSGERVRQIFVKCLERKPDVEEDKYLSIFKKYDFSRDDFCYAYDENEFVYNYLMLVCGKRGTIQAVHLSSDESFPLELRVGAEKLVFKNYITIGNERVYKNRPRLADYVVRTYFQNEAPFDEFVTVYNRTLAEIGLADDPRFFLNKRSYESKFGNYYLVLWKRGRKFRYYDMSSYDFSEFLQELALTQYINVEYSALKFFREYPELMRRYDIRDEYELHNLLKKICQTAEYSSLTFGKMPMIKFGKASRDKQVLDMLMRLAPVAIQDFAAAYEDEYGILPDTFMGMSSLRNFNEHFHNGICDISAPKLPKEQLTRLAALLAKDYYEIMEIKSIYVKEFPGEPDENINPSTLKSLDFNVFTTYVLRNKYSTAIEYFTSLLTNGDFIDTQEFPSTLTNKGAYYSALIALRDKYKIVEYEPSRYVSLQYLNSIGITKEIIKEYCNAVAEHIDIGVYFTVTSLSKSLKKSGFSHALDNSEFGDEFYAALLAVDKKNFSYQRMGGTKVFCRGTVKVSLVTFFEAIINHEVAIYIYDLIQLLDKHYGVIIDRYKIKQAVGNSSMYYDSANEKIYNNYDIYLSSEA